MPNPALLIVFVLGLFFFIVFNVVSRVFYKHRHRDKYHFYQMFPYEFNYPSVFKENPYGNLLFVFGSLGIMAFYILNPYTSLFRILALVTSILFTMILICLIMMPLNYLKTHMVLSCLAMVLSMVLPLFNLFQALNQKEIATNQAQTVLCFVSIIISAILSLTMLLLILNPKLTFRIYLDKTVDAEGNEVLKRPKIIFLALNEWMSIFIYFLSPIGILLISLL